MPEGTVVSASPDAATSGAVLVGEFMGKLLPPIFAPMMFASEEDRHLVGAPIALVFGCIALAGVNQWGIPFADLPSQNMNCSGGGARSNKDGIDSGVFQAALHAYGSDHEELEVVAPVLYNQLKHTTDSCGHGKYRGGSGIEVGLLIYDAPFIVRVRFFSCGRVVSGNGLFGGYHSYVIPWVAVNNSNMLDLVKAGKDVPKSIHELVTSRTVSGDYMMTHDCGPDMLTNAFLSGNNTGGGGYGDVLERDPQAVVDDVRAGIVSDWAARNIYRVAYNTENWVADLVQTQGLRSKELKDRIGRGKELSDFESEWRQKKPAAELTHYGSWPDAKPIRQIIRV
jgi:acetophenone carboxylase